MLATLSACHRKKVNFEEIPVFEQFKPKEVHKLICILRLGVLPNIKRQDNIIPDITASVSGTDLSVHFTNNWLDEKPLMKADLDSESQRVQVLGLKVLL